VHDYIVFAKLLRYLSSRLWVYNVI